MLKVRADARNVISIYPSPLKHLETCLKHNNPTMAEFCQSAHLGNFHAVLKLAHGVTIHQYGSCSLECITGNSYLKMCLRHKSNANLKARPTTHSILDLKDLGWGH